MDIGSLETDNPLDPNSTLARLFLRNPERLQRLLENVERQLIQDRTPSLAAIYQDLASLLAAQDSSGILEQVINGQDD